MSRNADSSAVTLDRVAIALSALCLLHCLALPLALIALPLVAQFAESHWHTPMLLIAVPVSTSAIVIGYRRHGNLALLGTGALALTLLILAATVAHAYLGETVDRTLTVAASLLLAWVHWQNGRALRRLATRER